jgi:hypothetical protein
VRTITKIKHMNNAIAIANATTTLHIRQRRSKVAYCGVVTKRHGLDLTHCVATSAQAIAQLTSNPNSYFHNKTACPECLAKRLAAK